MVRDNNERILKKMEEKKETMILIFILKSLSPNQK